MITRRYTYGYKSFVFCKIFFYGRSTRISGSDNRHEHQASEIGRNWTWPLCTVRTESALVSNPKSGSLSGRFHRCWIRQPWMFGKCLHFPPEAHGNDTSYLNIISKQSCQTYQCLRRFSAVLLIRSCRYVSEHSSDEYTGPSVRGILIHVHTLQNTNVLMVLRLWYFWVVWRVSW